MLKTMRVKNACVTHMLCIGHHSYGVSTWFRHLCTPSQEGAQVPSWPWVNMKRAIEHGGPHIAVQTVMGQPRSMSYCSCRIRSRNSQVRLWHLDGCMHV